MISKSTIDTIFNTARVEEVIGDFVQLKRAGSNLKGLSPFTEEKTPSFVVSPSKQIWKDFSTGKGGNVVSFLMELEQFSYPEALRWLANRYQIEIEEDNDFSPEQVEAQKLKESLYILTDFAKKFFVNQLHETEEGNTIGLAYFKERGFSTEIINRFELGYSPNSWDAFAKYALSKGFSKEVIEASGLVNFKEDGKNFDKFRERVIFPIYSFSGRAIGFGGRTLRNDIKAAKYLNSPENDIYHKSKTLYGLFQAKQAIIKQDECLLVEGYTDVLSLHQAGIENVVASSGTALTKSQIMIIKRLTSNITVMYDGDAAGIKASFRGIDLILAEELNVKVLLFPDGEDPDSFARKNSTTTLTNYIKENSTDFIKFKANLLLNEANNDPVKKTELIREIVQSISLVPNIIQREVYILETSKIMDIKEEILYKYLAQLINKPAERQVIKQKNTLKIVESNSVSTATPLYLVEKDIIKLMLQLGNLEIELKNEENNTYNTTITEEIISQFEHNDLSFSTNSFQEIFLEVKEGIENNIFLNTDHFIRHQNLDISKLVSEIMFDSFSLSENWHKKQGIYTKTNEEVAPEELFKLLLRFKTLYLENKIAVLLNESKNINQTDEQRLNTIEQIMELTKIKNFFNSHLDRIV